MIAEPASLSEQFQNEIGEGLLSDPKRIPSKFFYDAVGAELFEKICELPEYYPTRTEITILKQNLPEMARMIGPHARIIEFGSGAGTKTRMLLDALETPELYIPIDISAEQLELTADTLKSLHPTLEVLPIAQDYTTPIHLPTQNRNVGSTPAKTIVFFPGSTIGNFEPSEAETFLLMCRDLVGDGGGILIGVDLVKAEPILNAAYNDSEGVTAEFNLHLIERIRDELHVAIDPRDFKHVAFFNPTESRVEMHLVATRAFNLAIGKLNVHFAEGEDILTEYSYKYTDESFARLAEKADLSVAKTWHDANNLFAIYALSLVIS